MKLGALLKWGILIKGVILKGWPSKFAVRQFYNGQGKLKVLYKNLMKSPNNLRVVSIAISANI
jgi:hypothetical protein